MLTKKKLQSNSSYLKINVNAHPFTIQLKLSILSFLRTLPYPHRSTRVIFGFLEKEGADLAEFSIVVLIVPDESHRQ